MKSTWREQFPSIGKVTSIGKVSFAFVLAASLSGCQTWSPSNWGVPAGTRVPPPATGSYPTQGAYYNSPSTGGTPAAPVSTNKTSQFAPGTGASVVPASATRSISSNDSMPANGSGGINNLSGMSASLNASSAAYTTRVTNDAARDAQVRSADYTDGDDSGMAQVVSAASMQSVDPQGQLNGSFEVKSNGAGSNLQWK